MDTDADAVQLASRLRGVLCDLVAAAGNRRLLPLQMYLGTPRGDHLELPHDPGFDRGLRADVVERALDGLDLRQSCAPVPWLTRSGDLAPGDADVAWFVACREGYARHGVDMPGFFLITRRGWLNLADDRLVRVNRVRRRSRARGP